MKKYRVNRCAFERRLVPDFRARIVTHLSYAPRDFDTDLAAQHGSAFSLLPSFTQSAYFRTHSRYAVIKNLCVVGA